MLKHILDDLIRRWDGDAAVRNPAFSQQQLFPFGMPRPLRTFVLALSAMGRRRKQALMMSVDALILVLAVWSAYSLRLSVLFIPNQEQALLVAAAPLISIPVFYGFGLYRSIIRYVGEQALWAVVRAVGLSTLMFGVLAFMTRMYGYEGMPRSVLVFFFLLSLPAISGVRYLARFIILSQTWENIPRRYVIIYGASDVGRQIAAALRADDLMLSILFVDEDRSLRGHFLDGCEIHHASEIPKLIKRHDVRDAIVTLRSTSDAHRREVVRELRRNELRVRILPAYTDVRQPRQAVKLVREVDISDLLGRDTVAPDVGLLETHVRDKVVLVTGAGGSIGAELCTQIAAIGPRKLVVMDISEHALYQVDRSLRAVGGFELVPVLGSVSNAELLDRVFATNAIDTVYHAAAYKHVPLVELNPFEGVRNNVFGTFNVAEAAFRHQAGAFVLISTDKAVRPTSVMGASKRIAEFITEEFANRAAQAARSQTFCTVRFGNVLGSSGSVVPLFAEQIRNGGPVTVTHPEATRYFMSVHEAVQLVIQAGSLSSRAARSRASGGEIFLLDMDEPVKIVDLARTMIQLSGHTICDEGNPDGDIEIKIIGLRDGEKLHEEIMIAVSHAERTAHPKIFASYEPVPFFFDMEKYLGLLRTAVDQQDEGKLANTIRLVFKH